MLSIARLFGLIGLAACVLCQTQVHLGLTNAAVGCTNGVSINFASTSKDPIQIKYSIGTNESFVSTTSDQYQVGKYTSPYLHSAKLCSLSPNTEYKYSIGSNFQGIFVSPPATGSASIPTVLGIVGDADLEAGSFQALLKPYNSLRPQAIVTVGDYSYANGNHKIWDQWYDLQQSIFSRVPNLGINGNHEVIQSSTGYSSEKYLGYIKRAATPITAANAQALRTYYSINIGLVHLVFLDDYVGSSSKVGSSAWLDERNAQLSWLQDDLRKVNRQVTPYVIVFKHNPYYNTWDDHQCQCSSSGKFVIPDKDKEKCWKGDYSKASSEPHCGLQAKLEDVYANNKVDVVFSGHVHGYERTGQIYQNKIDAAKGTVYITTGAGGRGHVGSRISSPPKWSLFTEGKSFGSSRLIATKEKLQILWFTNNNADSPKDSVELPPRQ